MQRNRDDKYSLQLPYVLPLDYPKGLKYVPTQEKYSVGIQHIDETITFNLCSRLHYTRICSQTKSNY